MRRPQVRLEFLELGEGVAAVGALEELVAVVKVLERRLLRVESMLLSFAKMRPREFMNTDFNFERGWQDQLAERQQQQRLLVPGRRTSFRRRCSRCGGFWPSCASCSSREWQGWTW